VPLVSRPETEKSLSTKACDAGAEITSCATSGTATHWGLAASFCCQYTRQQYPELEVVTCYILLQISCVVSLPKVVKIVCCGNKL